MGKVGFVPLLRLSSPSHHRWTSGCMPVWLNFRTLVGVLLRNFMSWCIQSLMSVQNDPSDSIPYRTFFRIALLVHLVWHVARMSSMLHHVRHVVMYFLQMHCYQRCNCFGFCDIMCQSKCHGHICKILCVKTFTTGDSKSCNSFCLVHTAAETR